MNIRELVLKERELSEVIDKNLNELDMIADLGTLPKYKNSKIIEARFNNLELKITILLVDKKKITDLIIKLKKL